MIKLISFWKKIFDINDVHDIKPFLTEGRKAVQSTKS